MSVSNGRQFGPGRQLGMSKWGWLIVIIVLVSAITMTLRIGPHYVDFEMVKGVLERLPAGETHAMSKAAIREHFSKQFRVEGFRIPLKEMLKIDRNQARTVLDINYEIREHLFYNVDVVLVFSEQRTFE